MADEQDDPDHLSGANLARQLVPTLQAQSADALDPVRFWEGFIASICAWGHSNIGIDKSLAILRAITDTDEAAAENRQKESH